MISHKYRCIFIHIPKCAGTSIESALGHLDKHSGRRGQDHRSLRMIRQPPYSPHIFSSKDNLKEAARRVRYNSQSITNPNNLITVTRNQYEEYFKFTFVRNPWARVYSWYKNVLRDKIHQNNLNVTNTISLNDFLDQHIGKGMLRPQTHWIKDYNGSIPLDYVGRFENLQDDFKEVCKRLNIKNISLPHKIKGESTKYKDAFDIYTTELVRQTYKEEIELFGYKF